jgi:hypothetical protein
MFSCSFSISIGGVLSRLESGLCCSSLDFAAASSFSFSCFGSFVGDSISRPGDVDLDFSPLVGSFLFSSLQVVLSGFFAACGGDDFSALVVDSAKFIIIFIAKIFKSPIIN